MSHLLIITEFLGIYKKYKEKIKLSLTEINLYKIKNLKKILIQTKKNLLSQYIKYIKITLKTIIKLSTALYKKYKLYILYNTYCQQIVRKCKYKLIQRFLD